MSQATLWESCLPVSAAGLNVRHSECLKLNAEGKPVTPFACRPHLPHQPFRMHQDKGACVCVWSQAAEGGNRPVGGGMGVGISLSDWPLSPPLERRSCLAAPLWTPLCACCHVSPCPRGCVPHSGLSLSICLCPHSPFALCFAFCPFLPFLVGALLLPYAPSLPLPCFAFALCFSASALLLVCLCWRTGPKQQWTSCTGQRTCMHANANPASYLCTLEFEWYCHHPTFVVCAFPPPVSLL